MYDLEFTPVMFTFGGGLIRNLENPALPNPIIAS